VVFLDEDNETIYRLGIAGEVETQPASDRAVEMALAKNSGSGILKVSHKPWKRRMGIIRR
jgi:hypothetical protein